LAWEAAARAGAAAVRAKRERRSSACGHATLRAVQAVTVGAIVTTQNASTDIARQNLMPDLSHLDSKNSLNAILNMVFGGRIFGHPGQGLLTSYVRVMDKTVLEYEAARSALSEWIASPNNVMSPLFRTIDHLETCVDSLHRVSLFAERLRRLEGAPAIDRPKLPHQRERDQIRQARDAIQHADDDILEDKTGAPNGHSVALLPMESAFEVGGHEVRYVDLAHWIEKYHALVRDLIH
jgi:hypothetical protein